MIHRLILKVAKCQLSPPKRLGTVVKNHFISDSESVPRVFLSPEPNFSEICPEIKKFEISKDTKDDGITRQ